MNNDIPPQETYSAPSLAQAVPPAIPVMAIPAPKGIGSVLELLLRNPTALVHHMSASKEASIGSSLLIVAIISLSLFGIVVGSFSGGIQWWAAPLKITLGMLFSTAICFPSLYIFTCLSGIEIRISKLIQLVLGMTAITGILLLGFAPVSWVFAQSTDSIPIFGFLNLVFWAIGIIFGLKFLSRQLVGEKASMLSLWVLIFLLVCMQMTTTLRPIIGKADTLLPKEKKFFLSYMFMK
ncbi:MAG: hypothetical protein SFY80_02995 [Verrucomicrobiota bacterium]|nr:hypothetical protein [Verrucomicrobiota bacterium]